MPETTVERWLSLPEAAEYLGVAMRTMYNLVGRREIRATGWPMGISQSELEDFTRRSRIKPGQLRRLYERPTVTWSTPSTSRQRWRRTRQSAWLA
ncbi:MAG TPA: helix-turn-helix domain-containing protein [Acidimicrobiales bacterium]|nr:helix-turn-helix domain-containing protein [Acidimicrobiales bacterium]